MTSPYSFELAMHLGSRDVLVLVLDHQVRDLDHLEFVYRVFDVDEEAELTNLPDTDHQAIERHIMRHMQASCGD